MYLSRFIINSLLTLLLASSFIACNNEQTTESLPEEEEWVIRDSVVCYSLRGEPLKYVDERKSDFERKDSLLQIARDNYANDPGALDNIIWYGRRLAYLTEYREAMSVYTRGLHIHPKSPHIYRHRGHRYISLRRFEEAENDLHLAAELARGLPVETEPDGIPNKLNKPLSSLQFNIWYHLALAEYLQGNYEDAARAYDSCYVYSTNPDLLIATTYWAYLTHVRLNDSVYAQSLLAPINAKMEIVENEGYRDLLLLYKGAIEVSELESQSTGDALYDSTRGYGIANYYLMEGDREKAQSIMENIVKGPMWPAFGHIAAEADLAHGL